MPSLFEQKNPSFLNVVKFCCYLLSWNRALLFIWTNLNFLHSYMVLFVQSLVKAVQLGNGNCTLFRSNFNPGNYIYTRLFHFLSILRFFCEFDLHVQLFENSPLLTRILVLDCFDWPPNLIRNNGAEFFFNYFLFCLLVKGLSSQSRSFSLIWGRHHYRWRVANFDLCTALMGIEQWGFFSVSHPLWHGASAYTCNGYLRGPVHVTLTPIADC